MESSYCTRKKDTAKSRLLCESFTVLDKEIHHWRWKQSRFRHRSERSRRSGRKEAWTGKDKEIRLCPRIFGILVASQADNTKTDGAKQGNVSTSFESMIRPNAFSLLRYIYAGIEFMRKAFELETSFLSKTLFHFRGSWGEGDTRDKLEINSFSFRKIFDPPTVLYPLDVWKR